MVDGPARSGPETVSPVSVNSQWKAAAMQASESLPVAACLGMAFLSSAMKLPIFRRIVRFIDFKMAPIRQSKCDKAGTGGSGHKLAVYRQCSNYRFGFC
ncbi:hypothetical protein [Notoacmeibacter ruber]|uniref:hypothetical protein n=1 Tax=Notoacmeibacter ruber TaxID=2670375 RepID=UPI001314DCDB|nr:hypothetical protein [Notoacmeibacter ruber]